MQLRFIQCIFVVCLLLFPGFAIGQDATPPSSLAIPESDEGLPGAGPIRRYDWFKNLWQQRRSRWAEKVQKDKHAVVFFGDSITQGWGDDFSKYFAGMKAANRGISGDTTRGMLIRLQEDVLALEPKSVVMLMGTNDLEEGAEPETIAGNMRLILAEIKKYDSTLPVILCQVFPSSDSKRRPAEKIQQINDLYWQLVKGDRQVTFVETYTLFANQDGDAKLEEFPDLLHPNADGYAKWAGAIRPILATQGFLETESEPFELEDGFVSLFNGKDLSGWCFSPTTDADKQVRARIYERNSGNPAWPLIEKEETFEGKQQSSDGRYQAINGRLTVTTPPEGRRIQTLSTIEKFPGDFTLKLEFRATPNADSGVFIRGRQLQCRDYPLAGPYKDLQQYRQGDWNELVIVVRNNVAQCTCNGEMLEPEFTLPESGSIGLEGDRGQIEYRRIRISR